MLHYIYTYLEKMKKKLRRNIYWLRTVKHQKLQWIQYYSWEIRCMWKRVDVVQMGYEALKLPEGD